MHAANSRCMSVKREDTLATVSIPHFDRSICRAANDSVAWHLWRPNATSVTNQGAQTLNRHSNYTYRASKQDLDSISYRTASPAVVAVLA